MNSIDYPNISNQKSTEENMLQVRAWANQISDLLNYKFTALTSEVQRLEKRVAELEEKTNA